ncbi:MAG: N,N'-diacetylchitobiose phosphorylase [candidate division KSB1 bacterium]|nr:N,N'-diacetylchitobiose phosphorylase [candidate division KSB1 bacterium]
MQYGYFDDERKEYVITRPDTPKSWSNYLGSTEYGAIITNNAGGYSFWKSGGMGRFMRFRFNSITTDQPGRFIYIHDYDSKDFWSTSWQPVGKPLEKYRSTCRHGTGYTIISSRYDGILSEVTYFVPLGRLFEVWKVTLENQSGRSRKLGVFTYAELVGNWNAIDDLLNIQYVQYTAVMRVIDGIIDHGTNVHIPEMPDNFKEKDQGRHSFTAFVGLKTSGYDTDREAFLGHYRTYANPIAVERGKCSNSLGYGDNPCAALEGEIILQPGESRTFLVLFGVGRAEKEGKQAVKDFSDLRKADIELEKVKEYWHRRLVGLTAVTPDAELNSTINVWGIYNALITYAWSRSASLIYSGIDRDGLGYRDTVQDLIGVMHCITDEARQRLELMLTGQVSTGGAMPVILPFSHSPGKEKPPAEDEYRSDDALWLFNAVSEYVKETGDMSFYRRVLPYADQGEDTVLGHLKRAIQFSWVRRGAHGLPCGLKADWNDCLRFGAKGESVFVAMQLRHALVVYREASELLGEQEEAEWANRCLQELDQAIQAFAWDGEWFLRGYSQDGQKFGSKENREGQIYLNPQSWAIISGAARGEQAEYIMNVVNERLATDYGLAICDPPYTSSDYNIVRAQLMNPGLKENGGIFMHIQGWAIIAEAILGHGDRAYRYLRAYLPAAYNQKAEVREIEPYVLCQSTHGRQSPKHGASRIPWLSGSAAWTFYAITHYILGIRPEYDGLYIDPCIPSYWKKFQVTRLFRGKRFEIAVENPNGVQKGVKKMTMNGKTLNGNLIPQDLFEDTNSVLVEMG